RPSEAASAWMGWWTAAVARDDCALCQSFCGGSRLMSALCPRSVSVAGCPAPSSLESRRPGSLWEGGANQRQRVLGEETGRECKRLPKWKRQGTSPRRLTLRSNHDGVMGDAFPAGPRSLEGLRPRALIDDGGDP